MIPKSNLIDQNERIFGDLLIWRVNLGKSVLSTKEFHHRVSQGGRHI